MAKVEQGHGEVPLLSMSPGLCCFGPREGVMYPGECPVCHISHHIEHVGGRNNFGPQLLYQRSYKGRPEYISPRCWRCYEKAEKKLLKSLHKISSVREG